MQNTTAAPLVLGRRLINDALAQALEADEQLILAGEAVDAGGLHGTATGLAARFPGRVRGLRGSGAEQVEWARGLAAGGRPVLLHLADSDLAAAALPALLALGAARYQSGSAPRLVIRITVSAAGGPGRVGPLATWLGALPGLRVVVAGDPLGACALLASALQAQDPVVLLEPERLYIDELPLASAGLPAAWPLDRAALLSRPEGAALTLVSWGAALRTALTAQRMAAARGVALEVVDLRSLSPLDRATLLDSVGRTGRLLVAHDGPRDGGPGAQVVSLVAEWGLVHLAAPPVILGGLSVPADRAGGDTGPSAAALYAACLQLAGF